MAKCFLQSKVRYFLFWLRGLCLKVCEIQVLKIMLIVIEYNSVCTEHVLYLLIITEIFVLVRVASFRLSVQSSIAD
jgi:hypothetical protein